MVIPPGVHQFIPERLSVVLYGVRTLKRASEKKPNYSFTLNTLSSHSFALHIILED